jgi:hypothetical protein
VSEAVAVEVEVAVDSVFTPTGDTEKFDISVSKCCDL